MALFEFVSDDNYCDINVVCTAISVGVLVVSMIVIWIIEQQHKHHDRICSRQLTYGNKEGTRPANRKRLQISSNGYYVLLLYDVMVDSFIVHLGKIS